MPCFITDGNRTFRNLPSRNCGALKHISTSLHAAKHFHHTPLCVWKPPSQITSCSSLKSDNIQRNSNVHSRLPSRSPCQVNSHGTERTRTSTLRKFPYPRRNPITHKTQTNQDLYARTPTRLLAPKRPSRSPQYFLARAHRDAAAPVLTPNSDTVRILAPFSRSPRTRY